MAVVAGQLGVPLVDPETRVKRGRIPKCECSELTSKLQVLVARYATMFLLFLVLCEVLFHLLQQVESTQIPQSSESSLSNLGMQAGKTMLHYSAWLSTTAYHLFCFPNHCGVLKDSGKTTPENSDAEKGKLSPRGAPRRCHEEEQRGGARRGAEGPLARDGQKQPLPLESEMGHRSLKTCQAVHHRLGYKADPKFFANHNS